MNFDASGIPTLVYKHTRPPLASAPPMQAEMCIPHETRYDRKRCTVRSLHISLTVVYRFPDCGQAGGEATQRGVHIDFSRRREGKRVRFCE